MKLMLLLYVVVLAAPSAGCSRRAQRSQTTVEVPPDSPPPSIPAQTPSVAPVAPPSSGTAGSNTGSAGSGTAGSGTAGATTPSSPALPSVPLDYSGSPIIPDAPLSYDAHVILKTGEARRYRGEMSQCVCRDKSIAAYYVPCCGYYSCTRPRCG